jgi:hypothetical protein
MPNLQMLADRLLRILPSDGTQLPNDAVRTLLGQDIEQPITGDIYFDVLDLLETRGQIRRGRGRGGAVRRAEVASCSRAAARTSLTESQLMPSLQRYLELRFWRRLQLPDDAYWKVIDTSTGGACNGRWRRGDFTGVAIAPRAVLRGTDVELYTFELKAEVSGDIRAVHEAHAQTRGSHYGYLVWHVPDPAKHLKKIEVLEEECLRLGIGLIVFNDPQDLDSWERKISSVRQPTHDKDIDDFLKTRLDGHEIETIKARLAT